MESESLAAEGVNASASPELPPLQGTTETTALSSVEGSSSGLPAGFTANPEVLPLRSEAQEAATLRQVQNTCNLPEIGQNYLLTAQGLASAAAAEPQSPEVHTWMEKRSEEPKTVEQPTMPSPSDESCGKEQPGRTRS